MSIQRESVILYNILGLLIFHIHYLQNFIYNIFFYMIYYPI